jgi:hypothetical protein
MHRPLGRNLGIHNLFSMRIAIRGFSPAMQFVGSWLSGCLLTTLRCILPVKGKRGCNRTLEESARRVRWSVSPLHSEVTSPSESAYRVRESSSRFFSWSRFLP